jgi:hypothetical protein
MSIIYIFLILFELYNFNLKLRGKQYNKICGDCGATAKWWLVTLLLNQNKAGANEQSIYSVTPF